MHTEVAVAEQAYIQADLKGVPSWVSLPEEAQTEEMKAYIRKMGIRRPVVKLLKALYGHPDSGTYWEEHCDAVVRAVGFAPIGPE